MGTMLSVTMEYLQMFLPGRTSSLNDVLLNTLSSCFGGLFAWGQGQQSRFGKRLRTLRQKCFNAGRLTDIGLIILGAWALMQLAPFVPSLDFGDIKNGLKPIWYTMQDLSRFDVYKTATYSLYIAALAAVLRLVLRYSRAIFLWHFIFVGSVLLCKVGIVGRQLSLEAIAGFCVGTCILLVVQLLPKSRIPLLALGFVVAGFAVDELRPVISVPADFHDFSWIPFNSQIDNNMKGIGSIVEGLWPFAAMAYFFIAAGVVKRPIMAVFWGGGLACIVLLLEVAQKQIPGRYPDITIVLLAVVGWSLPWLFPAKGMSGETGIE
jgi:VanZ family protein